jgi:hypothetical protein
MEPEKTKAKGLKKEIKIRSSSSIQLLKKRTKQ